MTHHAPGSQINDVAFCPFEDVLAYGHEGGLGSLVIPGAGEANFDALEVNPYETKKGRREGEVRQLLNKLQPEMISMDPDHIGRMDLATEETKRQEHAEENAQVVSFDMHKNMGYDLSDFNRRQTAQRRPGIR